MDGSGEFQAQHGTQTSVPGGHSDRLISPQTIAREPDRTCHVLGRTEDLGANEVPGQAATSTP
jgi:hypothetical protein